MQEYIWDFTRLKEVSLANLGKLRRGTTYEEFAQKASSIAAEKGVKQPRLLSAMKYKADANTAQLAIVSGGVITPIEYERPSTETVYPIDASEWNTFIDDTPVYLTEEADIHVVDGSLYTAGF